MTDIYYYIIGILILALIYFGISYKLFKDIFINYRHKKIDLVNQDDDFYLSAYAWYKELPKEDEYITSYDNLKLHAVFLPSHDKKSNKIAVVIHGYKSKATDMVIIAKMYSDLGFKVLLIDQRGHGLSQGKFTSVGYYEAYDLKKWLHFITRNHGAKSSVLLHGVSMGASTAAMVMKFRESKQVKALVLDSCFTNFRETLRLSTNYPILRIFLFGISINSYLFLKFFLTNVNPLKQLKQVKIPTLIVHGTKDKVITDAMTKALYEAVKSDDKELLVIEDAKHAKAFEVNKDIYIQKVVSLTKKTFDLKKSDLKYIK